MNRREFLTGGLATLGAFAAAEGRAAAPAAAAPVPKTRPMTVNLVSVKAGATRPFSVFHISDTHLHEVLPTDPAEQRAFIAARTDPARSPGSFVGWDCEDALRASLAWARNHGSEYVLHTGDLIDFASDGNLTLVRKYFAGNGNLLYAPGNHEYATTVAGPRGKETEAAFRAVNTARVRAAFPVDLAFNAKTVNGVTLVMIDNVYGTVSPEIVERFHAEAKKGLPIILACHVPFYTDGLLRAYARLHGGGRPFAETFAGAPIRNALTQERDPVTAAFVAYLKREPLLKAILCGHHHAGMSDAFSPTAMEYVAAANFRYFGQEVMIF